MWQTKDNALYKEFVFKDFAQAFSFMQSVAAEAEQQQHHPRWQNNYNRVEIWLSSHDAGDKITEKDKTLAGAIDNIFHKREMGNIDEQKTTDEIRIIELKLYADGGSRGNPGPSASGYVLTDMDDKVIQQEGIYLGVTTNNQAEYQALKLGLETAKHLNCRKIHVYMDSLLVINQMLGKFKVSNRDLWPIHDSIKLLATEFDHVSFTHIPRELNKLADGMVNQALDTHLKHN